MTHLHREGMRPLTQGFAEAYREWREHDKKDWKRSKRATKLLSPDVTPEQFAEALEAIGITGEDENELARALSVALDLAAKDPSKEPRQAKNILRDPQRLSIEHQRSLLRVASQRYNNLIGELNLYRQIAEELEHWDSMLEEVVGDEEAEQDVAATYREMDRVERAAALISCNRHRERAEVGALSELGLRALLEGYYALSASDRGVVLRVLSGMLHRSNSRRASNVAREIDWALDRHNGSALDHLASVVSGNSEYLDYLQASDAQLNSRDFSATWPFSLAESEDWMKAVLDEYAGLG